MAVTLSDARLYIGIDDTDDVMVNTNLLRAINTAEEILLDAVGRDLRDYIPNDPRADELVLIYADDLYSERGVGTKVSSATRKLVHTMELQLKMALRIARETPPQGVGL